MQAEVPVNSVPVDPVIDLPNKEDEQFFPIESKTNRLSCIKRLGYPSLALSVFQIFAGAYLTNVQTSFFPVSLLTSGFLSALFLITSLYWTHTTTKTEEKLNSLTVSAQMKERIPVSLVLSLGTIKAVTILLHAQAYLVNAPGFGFPEGSSMLADAFLLIEIALLFLTFLILSTAYDTVKQPQNSSVFFFNTIMLGASIALALNVTRNMNSETYFRLSSLAEHHSLSPLIYIGSFSALLSVPTWIVSHRRYRMGAFVVAVFLLTLSVPLLMYSFSTKGLSRNVYTTYKDSIDAENIKIRSASMPAMEVESYRSLDKYPPPQYSEYPVKGEDGEIESYFSPQNLGVYSQLYVTQLLETSSWSIIATLAMSLTAISLLSGTKVSRDATEERKNPSNYKWLAFMAVVAISAGLMYGFHPDYASLNEAASTEQAESEIMSSWSFSSLFGGAKNSVFEKAKDDLLAGGNSTLGIFNALKDDIANGTDAFKAGIVDQLKVDALKKGLESAGFGNGVAVKVSQLVMFKAYRYVIGTADLKNRNLTLVDEGPFTDTYQAFLDKLDNNKAQYAVVWANLSNSNELKPVGVVWTPVNAPQAATDFLVNTFAPNATSLNLPGKLGFPVIVATNKEQLQPEALSRNVSKTVLLYEENGISDAWSFGEIFSKITGGAFDKTVSEVSANKQARASGLTGSPNGLFERYEGDLSKASSDVLNRTSNQVNPQQMESWIRDRSGNKYQHHVTDVNDDDGTRYFDRYENDFNLTNRSGVSNQTENHGELMDAYFWNRAKNKAQHDITNAQLDASNQATKAQNSLANTVQEFSNQGNKLQNNLNAQGQQAGNQVAKAVNEIRYQGQQAAERAREAYNSNTNKFVYDQDLMQAWNLGSAMNKAQHDLTNAKLDASNQATKAQNSLANSVQEASNQGNKLQNNLNAQGQQAGNQAAKAVNEIRYQAKQTAEKAREAYNSNPNNKFLYEQELTQAWTLAGITNKAQHDLTNAKLDVSNQATKAQNSLANTVQEASNQGNKLQNNLNAQGQQAANQAAKAANEMRYQGKQAAEKAREAYYSNPNNKFLYEQELTQAWNRENSINKYRHFDDSRVSASTQASQSQNNHKNANSESSDSDSDDSISSLEREIYERYEGRSRHHAGSDELAYLAAKPPVAPPKQFDYYDELTTLAAGKAPAPQDSDSYEDFTPQAAAVAPLRNSK